MAQSLKCTYFFISRYERKNKKENQLKCRNSKAFDLTFQTVIISGAHALGGAGLTRSGFNGRWQIGKCDPTKLLFFSIHSAVEGLS